MSGSSAHALALELLALGRVFLYRVAYRSNFSRDLVPYQVIPFDTSQFPLPRVVYNPELGRSFSEMLARVTRASGRGDWETAELWCRSALQVKKLAAVYRAGINVELADAVAYYYLGVVQVGKKELEAAVEQLAACAEQLAFTTPDLSAPFWLALARIHVYGSDLPNALWALERSSGLIRDCKRATSEVLRPLLEAEFAKITFR